jgi:pimeloyl-ACP methyl ester carboxylesterase
MRLRLILSDQDELIPASSMSAFEASMRAAGHPVTVTTLKNAPHKAIWTHPGQVTDAITAPAPKR